MDTMTSCGARPKQPSRGDNRYRGGRGRGLLGERPPQQNCSYDTQKGLTGRGLLGTKPTTPNQGLLGDIPTGYGEWVARGFPGAGRQANRYLGDAFDWGVGFEPFTDTLGGWYEPEVTVDHWGGFPGDCSGYYDGRCGARAGFGSTGVLSENYRARRGRGEFGKASCEEREDRFGHSRGRTHHHREGFGRRESKGSNFEQRSKDQKGKEQSRGSNERRSRGQKGGRGRTLKGQQENTRKGFSVGEKLRDAELEETESTWSEERGHGQQRRYEDRGGGGEGKTRGEGVQSTLGDDRKGCETHSIPEGGDGDESLSEQDVGGHKITGDEYLETMAFEDTAETPEKGAGSRGLQELHALDRSQDVAFCKPVQRSSCIFDIDTAHAVENPDDLILLVSKDIQVFVSVLDSEVLCFVELKKLLRIISRLCLSCEHKEKVLNLLQVVCTSRFLDLHLPRLVNSLTSPSADSESMTGGDMDNDITEYVEMIQQLITEVCHALPSYASKCSLLLTFLLQTKSVITAVRNKKPRLEEDLKDLEEECERCTGMVQNQQRKTGRRRDDPDDDDAAPPDDFCQLPIIPDEHDVNCTRKPYLRANKTKGAFKDADHYLDVQFRLLREDYIRPLREGLKAYKRLGDRGGKKSLNLRLYYNVRVVDMMFDDTIEHQLMFDTTLFKRVRWQHSKRLPFGALLCLSDDDFETSLYFAVVTKRDPADLEKGAVQVRFESGLDTFLEISSDVTFTMVETPAFFEAYRHVLEALKLMNNARLPFLRHIVECRSDVKSPRYMYRREVKLNMGTLLRNGSTFDASSIPVLELNEWPPSEETGLDTSQLEAMKTALTRELAIIQGPPGTGKTFVGLKLAEVLLLNRSVWTKRRGEGAILVVCYTNHALDQFLLGMLNFCRTGIIRVGSRCKNPDLEEFNLKEVKKRWGAMMGDKISDCRETLKQHENTMKKYLAQIDCINRGDVLDVKDLIHSIPNRQYMSLESSGDCMRRNFTIDWLALGRTLLYQQGSRHPTYRREDSPQQNTSTDIRSTNQNQVELNRLLRSAKPMTENEAKWIRDLWHPGLSMLDRVRLYLFWVQKHRPVLSSLLQKARQAYEQTSRDLQQLRAEEDIRVLAGARVIGMTTTRAARYRYVLEKVACPIVIIEEAAEVLEAHVVTTLHESCQHLILIGDHQQLRPSPTVYELCRHYHLDLSLFERLVNNNLPHSTLAVQHRMRPEVSRLVRHVYPHLEDHEVTLNRDHIRGMKEDVFFFHHEITELTHGETNSKYNDFEADMVMKLCLYLLMQGYRQHSITILAAYTGQILRLKSIMQDECFKDVLVTSVDNYQGEENDVIILSLVRSNEEGSVGFLGTDNRVCVALSRARNGLYAFGNFRILSERSRLWTRVITTAKEADQMGEVIVLCCENHPETELHVSTPEDFSGAPEGGCRLPCEARLDCGHVCVRRCHGYDRDHAMYRCMKPCERKVCDLDLHPCPKKCYENCGICLVKVEKTLPLCGHVAMVECGTNPKDYTCNLQCQTILPCGHQCRRVCGKCILEGPCLHPCGVKLNCGHDCSGTCAQCLDSRVHIPCTQTCGKILKGCGHRCPLPCGTQCLPCRQQCPNKCTHRSCNHVCGERCAPCGEPCPKRCKHRRCTSTCSKPCKPCKIPCKRRLKCRHTCRSFCGEKCVCYPCNKQNYVHLADGVVVDRAGTSHNTETGSESWKQEGIPAISEDSLLIKLPTCGHVFEVESLDNYVDNTLSTLQVGDALLCPACSMPALDILNSWRYYYRFRQRWSLLQGEKQKLMRATRVSRDEMKDLNKSVKMVFKKLKDDMVWYWRIQEKRVIPFVMEGWSKLLWVNAVHTEQLEKILSKMNAALNPVPSALDANRVSAITSRCKLLWVNRCSEEMLHQSHRDDSSLQALMKHQLVALTDAILNPTSLRTEQSRRELTLETRRLALLAKLLAIKKSMRAARSSSPICGRRSEMEDCDRLILRANSCIETLKTKKLSGFPEDEIARLCIECKQYASGWYYRSVTSINVCILDAPSNKDAGDQHIVTMSRAADVFLIATGNYRLRFTAEPV